MAIMYIVYYKPTMLMSIKEHIIEASYNFDI